MKKLIFLFLLVPSVLFGQQMKNESVITAGAGYSFLGALLSLNDGPNVQTTVTPAMLVSFDHGFSDYVSLGVAVGFQQANSTYTDYDWIDANGVSRKSNFEVKGSRLNIGARTLFHYGDIKDLDFYSGLRIAYQQYSVSDNSPNPEFEASFKNNSLLGFQLIAFGVRGFVGKNLGFTTELAIGSPYLAMVGVNYRFGGEKEE